MAEASNNMSGDDFQIKAFTENFDNYYQQLHKEIIAHNISKTGTYGKKEPLFLGCFNRKKLIAGLYGYSLWGMFYVDLLWVDENHRNKKLGSKLLMQAEEYANRKRALYIRVNTASFQALDFYIKNGYETFASLPVLIEGNAVHKDHYLVKYLRRD